MSFHFSLRRSLIAASIISLFACTAPEQQTGSIPPAARPQVAQTAGGELERKAEHVVTEADESRALAAPARDARSRLGMQKAAPASVAAGAPMELRDSEASLPQDTERYQHVAENTVHRVSEQPVSTFSIDVDTGAYANVRRFLSAGQLPPRDAVRVEELINYFPYGYTPPSRAGTPFAVHTELAPSPWNAHTHLLRIALKGQDLARASMPAANLVFLIDVSGSMSDSNKLPLLKTAFKGLTRELRVQDRVSLVVYAGASGVVLEAAPGDAQDRILGALERLSAGGSTHGAAGIELAYAVAQRAFIPGGINRVLLATDGDFNVGVTRFESLKDLIENKRRTGISLSTIGFGTGNYNEHMMEQLADAGNGNYSYIDTLNEARKVLNEELTSTLTTIARDVKIQVEFNPARVAEYRLVGYENRALRREDFNNDKVDAGEIGAGHAVTALYEIRLAGQPGSLIDPLRYGAPAPAAVEGRHAGDELALLRLRFKAPNGERSQLAEHPIRAHDMKHTLGETSDDFRFAASVAAFGQLLRGGRYLGEMKSGTSQSVRCEGAAAPSAREACAQGVSPFGYDQVLQLAKGAMPRDRFGYRAEFLELVATAGRLANQSGTERIAHGDE